MMMRQTLRLIIRWEWLILLVILPILMFPVGKQGLLLLLIPLLWVIRWVGFGRFIPHTPLDASLLLLLAMVLVSLTAVFDITLSFPKIAGVIAGIALYYATVEFARQREQRVWLVVIVLFAIGTAMALIGLVGAEWTGPFSFFNRLADGLAGGRLHIIGAVDGVVTGNELAGALGWVAPLMLACLVGLWTRLWQTNRLALTLFVAITFLAVITLIATQSRGGILGLGVAVLVMVAITFRRQRWLVLLVGAAVLALVIGVIAFRVPGGPDPVGDTFGLQGRLEIWSRALFALQDFPITGLSMNGFREIVHLLYPLFTISPELDLAHAHNHLLQAGLDLGIMGLIAYLSLWILATFLLWQSWRLAKYGRHHTYPLRVLIIGLSGSLAAGWVFGIMDAITLGARPGFVWWLLLALVTAAHDRARAGVGSSTSEKKWVVRRRKKRRRSTVPDPTMEEDDIPEFEGYSW